MLLFIDSRVPVINLEDGSRLSGDDAPLKKNLEHWLDQHPGYMVDSRVEELEEGEIVSGAGVFLCLVMKGNVFVLPYVNHCRC